MRLPGFKKENMTVSEFIDYWSKEYNYIKDYLYNDNIGKPLTRDRILALFEWKNATTLSRKKMASVEQNYINNKTKIPPERDNVFLELFLIKPGGIIWRIFWLHCNYPYVYPIYDRHVHRAMAKIRNWPDLEIPKSNNDKVIMYIYQYLRFWDNFSKFPPKKVDEALWSYGKSLEPEGQKKRNCFH